MGGAAPGPPAAGGRHPAGGHDEHRIPQHQAGRLPSPTSLHFQMDFFNHTLLWDGDRSAAADGVLYEVEYRSYGSDGPNWTSVLHCRLISRRSCDLTVETLPRSPGYYARVRSVVGERRSGWSRTQRYSFTQVNLPPPTVVLTVSGSSLHVELILPKITNGNLTRDYKDVFPYNRRYGVRIRRTQDNHMFQHTAEEESFSIPGLLGSNEYCVSVQPSVASRANLGEASSETCADLPEQGSWSSTLLLLAAGILGFLVLLICANLFICFYIRGVVKTPKTLKSLMRRSWSWMEKPPSPVLETTLCWESVVKDHPTAEARGSPMRSSADSGFGSRLFMNHVGEPSPLSLENSTEERVVHEPTANDDCKRSSVREGPGRSLLEDSGISLSTGSPTLQRTSSYTERPNRGNYCEKEVVLNVTQGYLKQLQPQRPSSLEDQSLEKTWQPQVKDDRSQGPENPDKDRADLFQEPWIQVSGTLQIPLPLTAAFSPFRRALWDVGVSAPSLGDVELLDTRS